MRKKEKKASGNFHVFQMGLKKKRTVFLVSARNATETAAMSPHKREPAPCGAELIVHAAAAVK